MPKKAVLYIAAANLLGGSSYVFVEAALAGFSPPVLVFLRTVIGAVLFFPAAFSALRSRSFTRSEWLGMTGVGILGYAAPQLTGTWGQQYSSATNAAMLIGIEPVTIVLLSAVFLGETISAMRAAAILSGLAGAFLIVSQGSAFLWRPQLMGDLLLLLHGFFWGLYTVIGKPVLKTVPPLAFTALTTWLSVPPIALAAWPSLLGPQPEASAAAWGALAVLGVFVTYLATIFWNRGLELVPASRLANFLFLQPLAGVGLGVFVQGDAFTPWSAAGGALILFGVYWTSREGS